MRHLNHIFRLLTLLGMLCLTSCDGGSLTAGGGIGGTGIVSSGSVAAMGSVWVNGVRYDTCDADVFMDGEYQGSGDQAVFDNLDVGRVVQVEGVVDAQGNGTAATVRYIPLLIGPIDSIEPVDSYATKLFILGQTVIVTDLTQWKAASLATIAPGNLVELSGYIDDIGHIQATFLVRLADSWSHGDTVKIAGKVSNLDIIHQHFTVNTQRIHFSQADMSAMAPGGIESGIYVSVTGRRPSGGTEIIAETVEPYRRLGDIDGGRIALEGIVSPGSGTHSFAVSGYGFNTNQTSTYVGGTEEDLIAGVQIELEGRLDQGALVPKTITFSQRFRAESDLLTKDAVTGVIVLAGLEGITFKTNELSRFSGLVTRFDDLSTGNHLVIKGMLVDDRTVLAKQVIALPEVQDKVTLRGTLLTIDDPVISINGVAIDTNSLPADGFYLDDDVPILRDTFFSIIQTGDWVQANGNLLSGSEIQWQSIIVLSEE